MTSKGRQPPQMEDDLKCIKNLKLKTYPNGKRHQKEDDLKGFELECLDNHQIVISYMGIT